jgi:tetratricopeptide (TPR) repeat protein
MTMLDADEYLHLAIHASSTGERHAGINYLKKVLELQPKNASALYLLAALHAELGLFERAIREVSTALNIEPKLEMARFQLGLLLLDRNRNAEAKQQFSELHGSTDGALRACSDAMIALADGDIILAQKQLDLGLAQASDNRALSALMRRLLDQLRSHAGTGISEARDPAVSLGAYHQTSR